MKIYQQLWTVFSNSTHLPLYPKHSEFFLVLYTAVTDSEKDWMHLGIIPWIYHISSIVVIY